MLLAALSSTDMLGRLDHGKKQLTAAVHDKRSTGRLLRPVTPSGLALRRYLADKRTASPVRSPPALAAISLQKISCGFGILSSMNELLNGSHRYPSMCRAHSVVTVYVWFSSMCHTACRQVGILLQVSEYCFAQVQRQFICIHWNSKLYTRFIGVKNILRKDRTFELQ